MLQVPSAAALEGLELVVPVLDEVDDGVLSVSGGGAEPATKWM